MNNVLQITDRAGVGVTVHAKWGLPHLGGAAISSQSPASPDYKSTLVPNAASDQLRKALIAVTSSYRSITDLRPEGGCMVCRQFCNVKIGDIPYTRPADSA